MKRESAFETPNPDKRPVTVATESTIGFGREMSRRQFVGSVSAAFAGSLVLDWVLAACTTATTSNGPHTAALFTVAVPDLGGENFTPWLASRAEEIVTHMYGETLIRANPTTRALEPALATSWELSADQLTWTIKLRPNVPFHGGYGMVTADDVMFTWSMYIRSDSTQSLAGLYRTAVGGSMNGFEIVSPTEFRLHATQPNVTLPSALSNASIGLPISSKKYWDAVGQQTFSTQPIGTGPYKFVSHTPGVGVTLDAVSNHWRQTPLFKRLIVNIISDDASRLAQVEAGQVDLASIPVSLKGEATAAKLHTISIPNIGLSNVMLGGQYPGDPVHNDPTAPWIQADNPDKGLAIRQALNAAIDRKSILSKILLGEGALAAAPVAFPPGNYAFDDPSWTVPTYDTAKAKSLLAQGGYPNGFAVDFLIFTQSGRPATTDIGQAVAGMWEAIGITVNRKPLSPGVPIPWLTRSTKGRAYQFTVPFYDEPLDALRLAYIPSASVAHFYDPAVSTAISGMSAEPDQKKRMAIALQLGKSLIQSVRAIPLMTTNQPYVVGTKIASWVPIAGVGELTNPESVTPA